MNREDLAQVCHAANKKLSEAFGDYSHPDWESASQAYKHFYVKGIDDVLTNPNGDGRELHEAWMQNKLKAGWIWGPTTDRPNRIHNCLVPYDDLPPHEKAKDDLFRGIVLALAHLLEDEDVSREGE
jgi:hypothetical protein